MFSIFVANDYSSYFSHLKPRKRHGFCLPANCYFMFVHKRALIKAQDCLQGNIHTSLAIQDSIIQDALFLY